MGGCGLRLYLVDGGGAGREGWASGNGASDVCWMERGVK
jgi:hypothetical protein